MKILKKLFYVYKMVALSINHQEYSLHLLKRSIITATFFDGNTYEFRGIGISDKGNLNFYNTLKLYPPQLPFTNFYFQVFRPGPAVTIMNFYQLKEDYAVDYDEQYNLKSFTLTADNYWYPDNYLGDSNKVIAEIAAINKARIAYREK